MRSAIFIVLILAVGCKTNQVQHNTLPEFEDYVFELKGFEWDKNTYKFTSYIRDSVFQTLSYQVAAWDFSYIGDIERMHQAWDSKATTRKELSQNQQDSFAMLQRVDAVEYILQEAKKHQFVIINEAHHMPQHRVFTTQLLDGLKQQGFKHLGLETYFANPRVDSLLKRSGYPTLQSGYYTKEPQFGNLVRLAHEKGFQIFGYESQGDNSGKEREINQARNIQQYLEKYPNEKVLIHCGFSHGYEGELSSKWEKAMAGRLTEFTSIDPLTINQVIYAERSQKEYEDPFYQLTDLEKPSVFLNQDNQVFGEYKYGGWFDIAVFHPRSKGYNRPKWMIYGDRQEVDFSFTQADIACPCLVFAYKAGEEIGSAIPYDIQETDNKSVKLVLDQTDFDIIIWNQDGKALKTQIKNRR